MFAKVVAISLSNRGHSRCHKSRWVGVWQSVKLRYVWEEVVLINDTKLTHITPKIWRTPISIDTVIHLLTYKIIKLISKSRLQLVK